MNELEASLIIRAGSELLEAASADPRSEEGYPAVKANLSAALDGIANALRNFEAASSAPSRSTGWAQDLRRVADDLAEHERSRSPALRQNRTCRRGSACIGLEGFPGAAVTLSCSYVKAPVSALAMMAAFSPGSRPMPCGWPCGQP